MATIPTPPSPTPAQPSARAKILTALLNIGLRFALSTIKNPASQQAAAPLLAALEPVIAELEALL